MEQLVTTDDLLSPRDPQLLQQALISELSHRSKRQQIFDSANMRVTPSLQLKQLSAKFRHAAADVGVARGRQKVGESAAGQTVP